MTKYYAYTRIVPHVEMDKNEFSTEAERDEFIESMLSFIPEVEYEREDEV